MRSGLPERRLRTSLSWTSRLPGIPATRSRRLREDFGAAGIIFVTGTQTGQLDRAAGLLVGADDYLVKLFARTSSSRASVCSSAPAPSRIPWPAPTAHT